LQGIVRFTETELSSQGISVDHLAEFAFQPLRRAKLSEDKIGHSSLERYPIVRYGDEVFFLPPTATSVSIRRFVIELVDSLGLRRVFCRTLAYEYARLFSDTPLLGEHRGAPISFRETDNGLFAGVLKTIDRGRYLNFLFLVDNLAGFEDTGL